MQSILDLLEAEILFLEVEPCLLTQAQRQIWALLLLQHLVCLFNNPLFYPKRAGVYLPFFIIILE
jgi:hypothetical protein